MTQSAHSRYPYMKGMEEADRGRNSRKLPRRMGLTPPAENCVVPTPALASKSRVQLSVIAQPSTPTQHRHEKTRIYRQGEGDITIQGQTQIRQGGGWR